LFLVSRGYNTSSVLPAIGDYNYSSLVADTVALINVARGSRFEQVL
jgi:hypothetical protein